MKCITDGTTIERLRNNDAARKVLGGGWTYTNKEAWKTQTKGYKGKDNDKSSIVSS